MAHIVFYWLVREREKYTLRSGNRKVYKIGVSLSACAHTHWDSLLVMR